MDLRDLLEDQAFRDRPRQLRDPDRGSIAFRHFAEILGGDRESVLQELVDAVVNLCGADSAGISLERPDEGTFEWVAVAGSFERYLHGRTPRNYSPCGTCLDTGRPQLYRVTQPYYDFLGVSADPITDGVLIPWSNEFLKGTLWAVSHSAEDAFDFEDYQFLKSISDFASIILGQQVRRRQLTDAEKARADADTRLKRIMETDAVGMIFFDGEGTIIEANDVFLRMVDYTRDDVASRAMTWRKLTPPEWVASSEEQMRGFVKTGRIGPYEKEYFRKDGSRRWMLFAGRDLGDGTIVEYAIDITDRKRAEAALVRNDKLSTLGRLAASIAHEINNPLEATTNLLYLARTTDGLPVEAKDYLILAEAELKRVAHITRQSLGFYRESSQPSEVSLPELLEATIDLLQAKITSKQAHIDRRWKEDVTVRAVAGELRQVFSNLMANSLDAIDVGGTITVRAVRHGSDRGPMARVSFSDSGCGIEHEKRKNIFDPFFTTKQELGNGLGLWVTSQIMEKHRGTLRMRSRTEAPYRGTTFSLCFPLSHNAE
ncbi:ATP-binding protein [Terriglobus roseus]|uniref:histidine kinase n=1 Tax=Terriglobus roseus TaxID=392734 RepID=A0A1G7G0L2_9BACT|nr:ATP-binding protein [Terriglobus roseus]SDE81671.1 PAS domain S-box-containing protein [Terriglobus roseus]